MSKQNRLIQAFQRGFTLVELMVAIAVIAILTAIALPGYQEYIRRGYRADARAGLLQAQQWLERAATATGNYPASLPEALEWKKDDSKRYSITITPTASGIGYTLSASPKANSSQNGDKCGNYILDHTGQRGNVDAKGSPGPASPEVVAECWDR